MKLNKITPAILGLMTFGAYANTSDTQNYDETLVVTASGHSESADLAPATIEVLEVKDLELTAYRDLTSVLDSLAGVYITDLGIGNKGVSIRGLDSSQTLILVDGKRASGSDNLINHGNYSLQGIPVGNIERIEVIKGPLSALYGSNALGGVVNVITKQPTNEWKTQVNLGAGSLTRSGGDNYNGQVSTSGAIVEDVLYLDLSVSHQQFDEVESRREGGRSDQAATEASNVQANLRYDMNDQHTLQFGFEGTQLETGQLVVPGGNRVWMENHVEDYRVSVGHQGDFVWGSTEIKAYHNNFSQKNVRDDGNSSNPHDLEESIVDAFVRTGMGMHELVIGGSFMHQKLTTPGFGSNSSEDASQGAVFAQDEIALNQHWDLLLGGRIDHHETFGTHFTPRAYLVFQPNNNWVFKGGYGEGFSAPNLTQMSDNFVNDDPGHPQVVRGNSDLKPEENAAFEISGQYIADTWSVGVTAFHNDVTNLIELSCIENCSGENRAVHQYQNIDEARMQGIEANVNWQIMPTLSISGNTTFLDAKDKTQDTRLEERPRWTTNATVRWEATEKWELVPSWRYIGEQERTARGQTSAQSLPGYSVVDLTSNHQINSQWRINVGISNMFDVYLPDESDNYIDYFVEPGRRIFINSTWDF
ncbi:TonB-dependent receptor plug domain-containing protein [Vibrio agarivorans]|uniref:TonB-dependent receptor plug domain-containing protein n=1 Tax=Vibrio agarivorans TaxID=153622 RepID=UPI002231CB90|nr:TonB-dependent receptor [Vibrio agarivorans]